MKSSRFILVSALAAIAAPLPAPAHITFSNANMVVGARYQVTAFRVSHGCEGAATVSVRMEIPSGVTARPQAKAGWIITTEKQPLPTPITVEGRTLSDRVSAITWSGHLPDDQFDEFGLMLNLPKVAGALYFPTHQICEKGGRDWTDIPSAGQAWHDLPNPAPVLNLTGSDDSHADHMMMGH